MCNISSYLICKIKHYKDLNGKLYHPVYRVYKTVNTSSHFYSHHRLIQHPCTKLFANNLRSSFSNNYYVFHVRTTNSTTGTIKINNCTLKTEPLLFDGNL